MLEKLLGVSPPQKGLAQDSKVGDKKNLPADFKKDFERQLQKKLDQKSTSQKEDPKDPKARSAKKSEDELRADRNEKKPSGGNKKKMVDPESDVKMISNVMALPESEFEIPDQKIDLATIETEDSSKKSEKLVALQASATTELKGTALTAEASQQIADLLGDTSSKAAADQPLDTELSELLKVLEQTALAEKTAVAQSVQPNSQIPAEHVETETLKAISFEEQLNKEVGFQSELKQHIAAAGLVQKMKDFESDKGMSAETALSFEQKVLEQLKQEVQFTATSSEFSDSSSNSENAFSSMDDSSKELKSDSLKHDSTLHLGQSHTDFKSHMATPLEKTGTAVGTSQLLENRDENVQEVMKQAQYLATKGGGEMTVKMSPDGMGEIQLKVLMEGGRLNIEMQTQDKSVKKLIEDSLTELKSGLAAQQLTVDHVKISTVNATNTENSTQFQANQDHSGQNFSSAQDQQKEFWKQFQNNFGSQARRGSYGDVQAAGPRASAEPNALQPIQSGAARANGRTGSTLNKVA